MLMTFYQYRFANLLLWHHIYKKKKHLTEFKAKKEQYLPVKHDHHVRDDGDTDRAEDGQQKDLHRCGGIYWQVGALAPRVRLAFTFHYLEL